MVCVFVKTKQEKKKKIIKQSIMVRTSYSNNIFVPRTIYFFLFVVSIPIARHISHWFIHSFTLYIGDGWWHFLCGHKTQDMSTIYTRHCKWPESVVAPFSTYYYTFNMYQFMNLYPYHIFKRPFRIIHVIAQFRWPIWFFFSISLLLIKIEKFLFAYWDERS